MAEADVAVIREMLDAFNRGDVETSTALLHEDAELHQAAEIPDTRSYYGRDDFARGVARWVSGFERGFRYEPTELVDAADRVFVRVMLRGRGRGSGIEIEQEIFQVYEVRDGRAYRCWVYWDEDEARQKAGTQLPSS
jgi:ketosteroid isomerase-like protein